MPDYPDEIRMPFSVTVRMPRLPDDGMIGERMRAPPPGALPGISRGSRRPNQGELVAREPAPNPGSRVHHVTVGMTASAAAVPALTADAVVTVMVRGLALSVSILQLPEVLAGLAVAAVFVVIAAGRRYAFTHRAAAVAWARQAVDALPQPGGMEVADPLPPLPPTEAKPELPAHPGYEPPTVRLPKLPMPGQLATMPAVLPGGNAEVGPFVLEMGDGTSSRGARRAARRADPEVTRRAAEADWRAHHLINLAAVRGGDAVIRAATRAGWRPDEVPNVAALPHTREAQEKLRREDVDRPVHDSGHPDWNRQVLRGLEDIQGRLNDRFGKAESPQRDRAALDALRKLQEELRIDMLKKERLTMLQGQPSQQDA